MFDPQAGLRECVYVVEADDYARHSLWGRFANEALQEEGSGQGYDWISESCGIMPTIANIEIEGQSLPVCLSIFFARIEGHLVMFWYPCSVIVHYTKIEEWLNDNVPAYTAVDGQGRRTHCDAGNIMSMFHSFKAGFQAVFTKEAS